MYGRRRHKGIKPRSPGILLAASHPYAEHGGRNEGPRCGRPRLHRQPSWCRSCELPGTRSTASTSACTTDATSGPRSMAPRRPSGHARRRGGSARGLRRGALPGGAVQRPARRPQPRDHVLGEPRRHAATWPRRPRRPASSASCSPRRAACTARPAPTR